MQLFPCFGPNAFLSFCWKILLVCKFPSLFNQPLIGFLVFNACFAFSRLRDAAPNSQALPWCPCHVPHPPGTPNRTRFQAHEGGGRQCRLQSGPRADKWGESRPQPFPPPAHSSDPQVPPVLSVAPKPPPAPCPLRKQLRSTPAQRRGGAFVGTAEIQPASPGVRVLWSAGGGGGDAPPRSRSTAAAGPPGGQHGEES